VLLLDHKVDTIAPQVSKTTMIIVVVGWPIGLAVWVLVGLPAFFGIVLGGWVEKKLDNRHSRVGRKNQ